QASRQDALPLTIAEAMAAGVPAVVSDAGGLPELVQNGVTGLVVPAGTLKLWRRLSPIFSDIRRSAFRWERRPADGTSSISRWNGSRQQPSPFTESSFRSAAALRPFPARAALGGDCGLLIVI